MLTGSNDGSIGVWNASTGEQIGSPLVGHTQRVNSLVFLPGDHQFVSGSDDGTAKLWDAASGKLVRTFTLHSGEVWFVAIGKCAGRGALAHREFPTALQPVGMSRPAKNFARW